MTLRKAYLSCILLSASGFCAATEWVQAPAEPAHQALQFERVLADGDGYLLIGRSDNRVVWLNVDLNGTAQAQVRDDSAQLIADVDLPAIQSLGDHRFVLPVSQDATNTACLLATSDRTGTDLTRARLARGEAVLCGPVAPLPDLAGGLWQLRADVNAVVHIHADGVQHAITAPPGTPFAYSLSPLLDAVGAYVLFRDNANFNLVRADDSGLAWTRVPPIASPLAPQVLTLSDGDALLVGTSATTTAPSGLFLARYAADGSLRWSRSYPELAAATVTRARLIGGDRIVVNALSALDGSSALLAFDGNGDLAWSKPDDGARFMAFVDRAAAGPREAPETLAYFVGERAPGSTVDHIIAIEYVDRDGVRIRRIAADDAAPPLSALLGDGSLVVLGATLQHYLPSGGERAVPALAELTPPRTPDLIDGLAAGNGDSFTLVERSDGHAVLRGWSADGAPLWQYSLDDVPASAYTQGSTDRAGLQSSRLIANDDLVCYGPLPFQVSIGTLGASVMQRIGCSERATGLSAFHAYLNLSDALASKLGLDGRKLLGVQATCMNCSDARLERVEYDLQPPGTGVPRRSELSAASLQLSDRAPFDTAVNLLADFGPAQTTTVFAGAQRAALTMFQQTGTTPARPVAISGEPSGILIRSERQADGSFLLHSWIDGVHSLRAIASEGTLRWTRHFPGELALASGHPAFTFGGGAGVVAIAEQQQIGERIRSHLVLLDALGGDSRWLLDAPAPDRRGVRTLGIDAARGLVLVNRDRPGQSVLSAYAISNGTLSGQRALPCARVSGCAARQLVPSSEGTLRSFGGGSEVARVELATMLAPARANQRALTGTWYNAATDGQGFLIDYSPTTGNLLAAWFGFADSAELGPAGLRWYTLVGASTRANGSIDLGIYRNQGGQFASAPITTAVRVGSAVLRMNDCQHAVLGYAFDNAELAGAHGEIGLQRLAPLSVDCQNADGSIEPATPALAADNGFSANRSGAWYQPASSGQGLLFDVRPASADGSDPGLLLGGWFTYDPAGAADDPGAQHWFLLQGDLAQAQNGSVEVPIYRVTGGRFDHNATRNVHAVGHAQVQFSACDRGRLSYHFDSSGLAGAFTGKQGEIQLERLLPCER
ncbi:MAG: hypothetical protein IPO66_12110 [Rhodanobacteraceae bacterium]|nr:hypothetical protein [Rhodanobacteraceae bacterium]